MQGHDDWLKKSFSDLKMSKKGLKDDDDTLEKVFDFVKNKIENPDKNLNIFKK